MVHARWGAHGANGRLLSARAIVTFAFLCGRLCSTFATVTQRHAVGSVAFGSVAVGSVAWKLLSRYCHACIGQHAAMCGTMPNEAVVLFESRQHKVPRRRLALYAPSYCYPLKCIGSGSLAEEELAIVAYAGRTQGLVGGVSSRPSRGIGGIPP